MLFLRRCLTESSDGQLDEVDSGLELDEFLLLLVKASS